MLMPYPPVAIVLRFCAVALYQRTPPDSHCSYILQPRAQHCYSLDADRRSRHDNPRLPVLAIPLLAAVVYGTVADFLNGGEEIFHEALEDVPLELVSRTRSFSRALLDKCVNLCIGQKRTTAKKASNGKSKNKNKNTLKSSLVDCYTEGLAKLWQHADVIWQALRPRERHRKNPNSIKTVWLYAYDTATDAQMGVAVITVLCRMLMGSAWVDWFIMMLQSLIRYEGPDVMMWVHRMVN